VEVAGMLHKSVPALHVSAYYMYLADNYYIQERDSQLLIPADQVRRPGINTRQSRQQGS